MLEASASECAIVDLHHPSSVMLITNFCMYCIFYGKSQFARKILCRFVSWTALCCCWSFKEHLTMIVDDCNSPWPRSRVLSVVHKYRCWCSCLYLENRCSYVTSLLALPSYEYALLYSTNTKEVTSLISPLSSATYFERVILRHANPYHC